MVFSVTLFEGIILLIIAGVSVIAWWGVQRLVKMSDDAAKHLNSIDKSLGLICERLGQSDIWMELHSKQDDERHEEIKGIFKDLWKVVGNIKKEKSDV